MVIFHQESSGGFFYEDISRDPMGIIWVNFNKTMGSLFHIIGKGGMIMEERLRPAKKR